MKKKAFKLIITSVMLVCFLLPQLVSAEGIATNSGGELDYLNLVTDMIKDQYKGEITEEQLLEGALKGAFESMDPYTEFYTPEEAESFFVQYEGNYAGVGASLNVYEGYVIVTEVFTDSPAEKAGILSGDKIAEVDGKSVKGFTADSVAKLVMGEAGTEVKIGIIRQGHAGIINKVVTRGDIKVNPVTYEIRDGIGYIKLELFNANAGEFMMDAFNYMDKMGVTKIVLDLRNNPGGEVSQAVAIARKLVPEGIITKLDFKSVDTSDVEYHSDLKELKYELAVLVNGMSASASEILAGAIQDTNAGTLIGTKTFGKAKVQNMYPLLKPEAVKKYEALYGIRILNAYDLYELDENVNILDEDIVGWCKITTGEYTTPAGRMIDKIGLVPDITVDDYFLESNIDINEIDRLKKTSKLTLDSECIDVLNTEKILLLSGYDIDTPDMKFDEKTFKAVMKFQKDNGLYAYGVLDFSTQDALNKKLNSLILKIDTQYVQALEVLR